MAEEVKARIQPLPDLEEWVKDYLEGVKAKKKKWKRRTLRPSRDPIKAGIAAEKKYAERMREVIETQARAKALAEWTFEDWAKQVDATSPDDYARGVERKVKKYKGRIGKVYQLWAYVKKKLAELSDATPEERAFKLLAAKDCMKVLGAYRKGVLTLEEAKAKIDKIIGGELLTSPSAPTSS